MGLMDFLAELFDSDPDEGAKRHPKTGEAMPEDDKTADSEAEFNQMFGDGTD